jgi:hypothetical protein
MVFRGLPRACWEFFFFLKAQLPLSVAQEGEN